MLSQIFHKSSINHSTLCLRKTTKFPNRAQNFATTISGQQQALHLLLAETTHSLLTVLPELEVDEMGMEKHKLRRNIT